MFWSSWLQDRKVRLAQKSLDLSAQQLEVTKAASLLMQDHTTCTSTKQQDCSLGTPVLLECKLLVCDL